MRLKGSLDLKVRREDPNYTIVATKEQIVGSRADATDLIILQKRRAFIIWRLDLANFEEIEGFPLHTVSPSLENITMKKSTH
jgi:hypothetical protein